LSFDHGDTFTSLFGLTGTTPNAPLPGNVTALAFGTFNTPHAVYVAVNDPVNNTSEILRSFDATFGFTGNYSFTDIRQLALNRPCIGMVIDPNNPLICCAITDSRVL